MPKAAAEHDDDEVSTTLQVGEEEQEEQAAAGQDDDDDGQKAKGKTYTADEFNDLKGQLDRLTEQSARDKSEAQEAIEYWAQRAGTEGPQGDEEADDDAEDDLTADDLAGVITEKGTKGLIAVLKEHGFTQKKDVEGLVQERATAIAQDAALTKDYPELADKSSPLFKRTAIEWQRAKADNVPVSRRTRVAVLEAEQHLRAKGQFRPEAEQDDEEQDRKEHVAGQQGRRRGQAAESDEDEVLTPMQTAIAKGFGVSTKRYQDRARKGVVFNSRQPGRG